MHTQTVMSEAFARARRKGPGRRLHEMAIEAIDAAIGGAVPDEWTDDGAAERLREYARMAIKQGGLNMNAATGLFLAELMKDAAALNELMGDRVRPRAAEYLHEVYTAEFAEKPVHVKKHERAAPGSKNGGQLGVEAHSEGAAIGGGGHGPRVTQAAVAPAANSPSRIAAAKRAGAALANSLLSSMSIDGVPVKHCTAGTARAHVRTQSHRCRWLEALCARLPLDEMIIGEHIDDDEAEQLWRQVA